LEAEEAGAMLAVLVADEITYRPGWGLMEGRVWRHKARAPAEGDAHSRGTWNRDLEWSIGLEISLQTVRPPSDYHCTDPSSCSYAVDLFMSADDIGHH
jgi:hypothetical protein